MTDFADLMSDQTILQALGDDVIYLGTGESNVAIKAMVSYGTQNTYASDAYVPEHNITIGVLKTDVPNIAKGHQFTHNGRTLICDVLLNDDSHFMTWVVR